jgi:hypothetical protein
MAFLSTSQHGGSAGKEFNMSRFDTSVTGVTTDTSADLTWTRGYAVEGEVNVADAEAAVAKLNAEKFAGIDTWRLPMPKELFGLVDHDRFAPAIDTDAFESGSHDWVWTGKELASSSDGVWFVDFGDGDVDLNLRDDRAFVRAVSGPSPAGQ